MILLYRALAIAAFIGGLWLHGYTKGAASVRAELAVQTAQMQQDIIEASARAARAGAALQAMRAANATALEDFENAAINDSNAGNRRVDPDSLRRLQALFAGNRAAP
jgi:hypothetical protein